MSLEALTSSNENEEPKEISKERKSELRSHFGAKTEDLANEEYGLEREAGRLLSEAFISNGTDEESEKWEALWLFHREAQEHLDNEPPGWRDADLSACKHSEDPLVCKSVEETYRSTWRKGHDVPWEDINWDNLP